MFTLQYVYVAILFSSTALINLNEIVQAAQITEDAQTTAESAIILRHSARLSYLTDG
jgi:hypothetical protein